MGKKSKRRSGTGKKGAGGGGKRRKVVQTPGKLSAESAEELATSLSDHLIKTLPQLLEKFQAEPNIVARLVPLTSRLLPGFEALWPSGSLVFVLRTSCLLSGFEVLWPSGALLKLLCIES